MYAFQGRVNYHIALYLIVGGDGGKDTQHFLIKGPEKVSYGVVGTGSDSGIKVFYNDFILHVHRSGGIQYHTP